MCSATPGSPSELTSIFPCELVRFLPTVIDKLMVDQLQGKGEGEVPQGIALKTTAQCFVTT